MLPLTLRSRCVFHSMGPEGFEPPPGELKARCAAVTPRPRDGRGIRFNRCRSHMVCSQISSRKRSRTFVSALSGRRPEPLDDRTECDFIDPCGIRTQPLQLERLATSPEVERAVLCAHRVRRVGREAIESSSADFQSAANPSQLPTHDRGRHRGRNEKSPMSR